MSQRSGNSPSEPRISSVSPGMGLPSPPGTWAFVSAENLTATAILSPTASFVSSIISCINRIRLARFPPYSSILLLVVGDKNCDIKYPCVAYTYTISKPASLARNAAFRCHIRTLRISDLSMARV